MLLDIRFEGYTSFDSCGEFANNHATSMNGKTN